MLRTIQITVDTSSWTTLGKVVPGSISAFAGTQSICIDKALLHTALRSRPPSYQGLHLADFWVWLRYFPAISSDSKLSLRDEWKELDAHQKTILSDDWGVGFSTYLISRLLGVIIWADTSHVVKLTEGCTPQPITLVGTKKRGPKKSPDFLGITKNLDIVVLECKGTQSSSNFSSKQIEKGVLQKQAISFSGVMPFQSLVSGLYVPLEMDSKLAEWQVRDPDPVTDGTTRLGASRELAKAILRSEICGFLKMMGCARLAEMLDVDAHGWPGGWLEHLPIFAERIERNDISYVVVTEIRELPRGTRIGDTDCRELKALLMVSESVLNGLIGNSLDEQLELMVANICNRADLTDGSGSDDMLHQGATLETPSGLRIEVSWE